MRWNLKEAGYWEHTNQWANLWSDEQKLHQAMHEGKAAKQAEAQQLMPMYEIQFSDGSYGYRQMI